MGHQRVLALTLAVGLVAACSSAVTPAPATQAPVTQAPATQAAGSAAPAPATPVASPFAGVTIRVTKSGDHAFDDTTIGYWMQQLKDKYGINVVYQSVATADVELRALVAGSTDLAVAMSLTSTVHLVQQTGTDVKLVAADTEASDYVLLAKSSIATVADAAGKLEAISAPGDASELVSHICLAGLGVDYSSLKLVKIGGTGARIAALLAGQVDIAPAHIADAQAAVAKSNGSIHILVDCGHAVANYPVTGMITTGAWLKANPALAQAVVDTYIDTMRWAAANKDAFIAFGKTWVPDQPVDSMSSSWDYYKSVNFWPVNGGLSQPELETYLGYGAQAGVLTGNIPTTDKWVDTTYVAAYLAKNGSQTILPVASPAASAAPSPTP